MSPTWIAICAGLQVLILALTVPWANGLLFALPILATLVLFAFTRQRWHPHLDMLLLMAAPGGLGMMLPMVLPLLGFGPACHVRSTWLSYAVMTAGMLLMSVPFAWQGARCLRQARQQGYGGRALFLDLVGMQAGMTLVHLPLSWLPMAAPRSVWVHHAWMVAAMLLGMLTGMFALRYLRPRVAPPAHSQPLAA